MESSSRITPELMAAFKEGNRRACARLITLVENEPELVRELPPAVDSIRIGVTGPPGVGKSTLTTALARGLAEEGHRVGVVAVDPSSPFTGGAFMGDRIRMDELTGDDRVFIRSLASREGHGGLSPSTPQVAQVLESFGMDRILIETVGVGQAELDVLSCTDLVLLVLQPVTGDSIQAMKAGIIEVASLIVVNKADLPGVDTVLQSLRFLFSLGGPRRGKPAPAIIATSAQKNEGIEKVLKELAKLSFDLVESGRHRELKAKRAAAEIRSGIQKRLWEQFAAGRTDEEILKLAEAGVPTHEAVERMCDKLKVVIEE